MSCLRPPESSESCVCASHIPFPIDGPSLLDICAEAGMGLDYFALLVDQGTIAKDSLEILLDPDNVRVSEVRALVPNYRNELPDQVVLPGKAPWLQNGAPGLQGFPFWVQISSSRGHRGAEK